MSDTPSERWLEDRLVESDTSIPDVFRAIFPCSDGCPTDWTRQFEIRAAGICDVIASCAHHRFLIVELKCYADEGAVSQVCRYLGAYAAMFEAIHPEARGRNTYAAAIVAFKFSSGCLFAAKAAGIRTFVATAGVVSLTPASIDASAFH